MYVLVFKFLMSEFMQFYFITIQKYTENVIDQTKARGLYVAQLMVLIGSFEVSDLYPQPPSVSHKKIERDF